MNAADRSSQRIIEGDAGIAGQAEDDLDLVSLQHRNKNLRAVHVPSADCP
jgi:hypothetical protein